MPPDTLCIPRPPCPVRAAVAYFGSQRALADAIGYSPSAIAMWLHRGRIPKRAARAIELATDGACPADSFAALQDSDDE